MVRRRSTVRFRNGAPFPQFRGRFRSWNWPLPVSVQQLSAAATLPDPCPILSAWPRFRRPRLATANEKPIRPRGDAQDDADDDGAEADTRGDDPAHERGDP